jgi:hypothetical protein
VIQGVNWLVNEAPWVTDSGPSTLIKNSAGTMKKPTHLLRAEEKSFLMIWNGNLFLFDRYLVSLHV